VIRQLHADYVRAGADVLSTNTFQLSKRAILNHFKDRAHMERIGVPGLEERAEQSLRAAVALADQARRSASGGRTVAIAGAITTLEWCFRPDLAPAPEAGRRRVPRADRRLADAGCEPDPGRRSTRSRRRSSRSTRPTTSASRIWVAFVPDEDGRLFTGETMAAAATPSRRCDRTRSS